MLLGITSVGMFRTRNAARGHTFFNKFLRTPGMDQFVKKYKTLCIFRIIRGTKQTRYAY